MSDKLSICITQKDRTPMLVNKLQELLTQDYNPKDLEICVTDGADDEELRCVLRAAAPQFDQIKYAFSDRKALPFVIPENNPACDINAQVCHVATYDKIIRTDAEIRFRHKKSLRLASDKLERNKELCFCFRSWHMPEGFVWGRDDPSKHIFAAAKMSFHCSCFWKQAFIRNRGVDEAFALGFAAEDSYFHQWWRKNRKFENGPGGYEILHLWHGRWQSENRLRLKHDYTMPLYKKYLAQNHTPNEGNDNWTRPEMIKDVQIWKA
jgi:hypothetical protein